MTPSMRGDRRRIEPFHIRVGDSVLVDLRERLARTRWPDALPGSGWDYGTDLAYARELCEYWREKFDWRSQEAALNAFPNFRTEIDGQNVHFIHVRSPVDDALPLVLIHGWPGSVYEFVKAIGPLVDPEAHGGSRRDAFHVVCPSLPGYGFSGPTREPGWHPRRIAQAFAELMKRLGYARYGVQGGDWGSTVGSNLAVVDASSIAGLHINLVTGIPPQPDMTPTRAFFSDWRTSPDFDQLSEAERRAATEWVQFRATGVGYGAIQSTKPQSLGYGLNDSPAGLAAWIVEKFRAWSDCGGDVEKSFTKDEMLANITIYWVTETINSANRLYYEAARAGLTGPTPEFVTVPTGCAIFPKEPSRPPRRWAERAFNVVHWSEMPRGGHFAAMEVPELLVADVRRFFRTLRG